MKINIKQLSFVGLGLIIITAVFTLSKLQIANADKENGKKIGDWTVLCSEIEDNTSTDKNKKKVKVCSIVQTSSFTPKDSKDSVNLALFRFGYADNKLLMNQEITYFAGNPALNAGTAVINSKDLVSMGKFITCGSNACIAQAEISDSNIKTILSNDKNVVRFVVIGGQYFNIPLSTKGLKEALNYIKK